MLTKEQIGQKIRDIRTTNNKSKEELGEFLEKSHAAISDIERGKTNLSVSELYKIANFFKTSIPDILGDAQASLSLPFTQFRDSKDMRPDEQKESDQATQEFIKLARQKAQNKK